MPFKTITAPYINANDMEMQVVKWSVRPWQFVNKDDKLCEIESTKAVIVVESTYPGYVYPLVEVKKFVKVGEPLAHIFPENDPKQLEAISRETVPESNVTVTKKARVLMEEHGLSLLDFPKFSSISSETVIAKIRELKPKEESHDKKRANEVLGRIKIDENSIVIYGEKNQGLLALDAFNENKKYKSLAYIDSSYKPEIFYGIPVMHNSALSQLKEKGLKYVYICGKDPKIKKEQEKECEEIGLEVCSAIHPTSVVSAISDLGKGIFIGAKAVIGPDVKIGDFSQVLCGATVAHHCKLGSYVSISDGANLAGNVSIGDNTLIGIGVNVNKWIKIGMNSIVVSGATVTDHVPDNHIIRLNSSMGQKSGSSKE